MPYLRAKAQDYYEELGGGLNSDVVEDGMDVRQLRALTDQASRSRSLQSSSYINTQTRIPELKRSATKRV